MNPTLIALLRTLLADPDRPDRDALFAVLADDQASEALACLAPPGSLLQIATALERAWVWCLERWERHTDELVGIITDPRCPSPGRMITTWSRIPNAVGVLRDRTDTLIAWARKRLDSWTYADLAILLGPSDESARLLVQSPFTDSIGMTLRRWSMVTDPDNPTAWQAMIDADLRKMLRKKARPSWDFPVWGWDDVLNPPTILSIIVDDIFDGWSPDHPSIRGRIRWLEHHVDSNLDVDFLTLVASIGRSDALAEAVCALVVHDPSSIPRIAEDVPWHRLHPRIQDAIDVTMRQASNSTWAYALGQAPLVPTKTIVSDLLLWRIPLARWEGLDPSVRAALVPRRSYLPHHCYGWGVHPDLVAEGSVPVGRVFRFWNPDVPPDDLRAWTYADLLREQRSHQDARVLIALLMTLSPNHRTRFEPIIDGRLGGRPEATAQSPWDWTVWVALPAADRQRRLRDRLRVLWGNRTTTPVYRVWMARTHLLDTVAVAVRDLLDGRRAPRILAALLAQIPSLRVHMPNPEPTLPFPDDLDAARRAQIERLPLAPNAQAYAAWCLCLLARAGDVGTDLIALHPDVVVALAPVLTADQQKAVAASPAAQGWESMTFLSWAAACAPAQEQPVPPIPRRMR